MADVMDFLDDDAFENCHSFEPPFVTIPESPGSSLKKSKNKSSKVSKSSHSSSSTTAGTSNSLERPKKKKDKSKDHDQMQQGYMPPTPGVNGVNDFNMDAYTLSLDILGSGEMENSARWVNKNQKKLAELFSMPIDSISIASPHEDHLTSPKKSSTIKKETIKAEADVIEGSGDHKSSKSSKSSSKSSSKKSHKSSNSTELTPAQAAQVVVQSDVALPNYPQTQQALQQMSFSQHLQLQADYSTPASMSTPNSSYSLKSVSDEELESKRQFHLACEQTRRKHIKDGLEELKNSLPSCENQKMTKAVILSKAIAFVQHSKRQKDYLTAQINVLRQENQFLRSSCQCQNHPRSNQPDQAFNFVPTIPTASFLKQQEKLQEYTPIQPKSQPKNIRPASTFVQPQLNQSEPPPPYSLPRHSNLLNVPDMRFRNPSSPASSVDGDSDTRSWADETEALPPGWEEIMTPDGKFFYVNKKAGLSSWVDPRLNQAINIQSQPKQRTRSLSGNTNTNTNGFHNPAPAPQYVDPLAVPVSPQWNNASLPDFMLPDLSAIQFSQAVSDSEMGDVKRAIGLGVDMNQCYSN